MLDLPVRIPLLMAAITLVALYAFYKSSGKNKWVLSLGGSWLALQAAVSLTGFYYRDFSLPPRFSLLIGPPLLFAIGLFFSRAGKNFLDRLDLIVLMWFHTVRIPLELCLLWLYQEGQVPVEMTFEGRNFGYFAGLTAPFLVWLAFPPVTRARRVLLIAWNVACVLLWLNIVGTGIASSPHFAERFGIETENRAVFYFPFVWLPSFVAPALLLAHLAAIRQLFLISRP